MNKTIAKKIATSGKVTWGEIQQTLKRAFEAGKADDRRSVVNKGLSKAHTYNIIGAAIKDYSPSLVISRTNYGEYCGAMHVLRDFGEFYNGWKPEPKKPLPQNATTDAIEIPF